MPRANRYIQPGYVYHLTHRCHNREFLLRCRLDRTEYCARLRAAVGKRRIALFDFCVTSNHVHLLGLSDRKSLAGIHGQRIDEAIRSGRLIRKGTWTESIAAGSEAFLREIASRNKRRKKLKIARTGDGSCYLRENQTRYARS